MRQNMLNENIYLEYNICAYIQREKERETETQKNN